MSAPVQHSALGAVRGSASGASGDDPDVLARVAWSAVLEPGDAVAGALIDALGPAALLALVSDGASPRDILTRLGTDEASVLEHVQTGLARWLPRIRGRRLDGARLAETTEPILRRAATLGVRLLVPDDDLWPVGVDDLGAHAPVALWVRGDADALETLPRSAAIVGARAATAYGEHVTAELAAGLAERAITVVSGAAYGIDGMAHRAALATGGTTIAFLAGGPDRLYPSGHEDLLHRIASSGGAIVTELPPGEPPTKWRFLQRNRLIAASTRATVVVEAGRRSGSLNTAGHAATLGRPLGAVPGPVTSPNSDGCHRLLREYDAICVTSAADAAELVGEMSEQPGLFDEALVDPRRTRLLDALTPRIPRTAAELSVATGLALREVQALLGALSAEGLAESTGAGWIGAAGRRVRGADAPRRREA